jgi:hypothetical protein
MGMVVAPAFTATSINGERAANTLATLQATRLSALEIAAGKLVAAWATSAAFLVVVLPFVAAAMLFGNISFWQVLVCFLTVFVEIAVVCAIGLGWSALMNRTSISTVMTYLTTVFLSFMTLVLAGLLTPFVMVDEKVRYWDVPESYSEEYVGDDENGRWIIPAPGTYACEWRVYNQTVTHPERIWWVTLANPFVIVADAAPLPPRSNNTLESYSSWDPLAAIKYLVRSISAGQETEIDNCISYYENYYGENFTRTYGPDGSVKLIRDRDGKVMDYTSPVKKPKLDLETPVWPWGLASNLLLGGVFFWITVRRLQIPYRKLPKGTRVA